LGTEGANNKGGEKRTKSFNAQHVGFEGKRPGTPNLLLIIWKVSYHGRSTVPEDQDQRRKGNTDPKRAIASDDVI